MPKCKVCGSRMSDGATICPTCGSAVGGTPSHPVQSSTPPSGHHQPVPQMQPPAPQYTEPEPKQFSPQYEPPQVQQPVQQQQAPQYQQSTDSNADEDKFMNAYITGYVGIPSATHAFEHYKAAFRKFKRGGFVNWNWATALFSIFNLIYRRNIGWAIVAWLCSLLSPLFFGRQGILMAQVLYFFILGLCGDRIMYSRYEKMVGKAKMAYPGNPSQQLSFVAGKGGTRIALIVVLLVLSFLFLLVCGAAIATIVGSGYYK